MNHRQASRVNVVISFLSENDEFKMICLDGAMIAEDGTADHLQSARLLEKWHHETECMFPKYLYLLEAIPDPSSIDITCMLRGMISHDNGNTAQAGGKRLQSLMLQLVEEKNIPLDE